MHRTALIAAATAFAMGASCGGSSDDGRGAKATQPSATVAVDSVETPSGNDSEPLNGPLVYISAVGLFSVDRESGDAFQINFADDLTPVIEVRPRISGSDAFRPHLRDDRG